MHGTSVDSQGLCDRARALLYFVFPVLSVHRSHRFSHCKVLVDSSLVVFVFPARVVGRLTLVHKHTDIIIHIRTQSYMQTHVKTCIHIIVPSWGVRLERVLSCGAQFRFGCDGN